HRVRVGTLKPPAFRYAVSLGLLAFCHRGLHFLGGLRFPTTGGPVLRPGRSPAFDPSSINYPPPQHVRSHYSLPQSLASLADLCDHEVRCGVESASFHQVEVEYKPFSFFRYADDRLAIARPDSER